MPNRLKIIGVRNTGGDDRGRKAMKNRPTSLVKSSAWMSEKLARYGKLPSMRTPASSMDGTPRKTRDNAFGGSPTRYLTAQRIEAT
jgi:hypothetical protein